ncbi:MAG: hypothetical protein KF801_00480 [Cryobacterium sp.]|nr:hypothetical protein [Cryobacterium sp.]
MTNFDFYGYLQVRLVSRHRGYLKYFDNEYARISHFGPGSDSAPIVNVEIVRHLPEIKSGDLIKTVRFKRLFTFHYLVRGMSSREVTIYFQRHWVDRVYMNAVGVYLQAQVLEPVMYQKLLEEGILLMHAGGVTGGGIGILLPAYGGTGKTTLSIALLNQGYRLLGDDLLLVDVEREEVHPYARPLHIFTYNVRNLRGAKIPFKYRFAVYAKNAIRFVLERILRTEFLISTRIHADEIFDGDIFGESSPIGAIAFLRKDGPGVDVVTVTPKNVDEIAEGIAQSADLNDSLAELFEEEPELLAASRELEHATIRKVLLKRGLIAYVNTRQLDLSDLSGFLDQILGRGSA